MSRHCCAEIS